MTLSAFRIVVEHRPNAVPDWITGTFAVRRGDAWATCGVFSLQQVEWLVLSTIWQQAGIEVIEHEQRPVPVAPAGKTEAH